MSCNPEKAQKNDLEKIAGGGALLEGRIMVGGQRFRCPMKECECGEALQYFGSPVQIARRKWDILNSLCTLEAVNASKVRGKRVNPFYGRPPPKRTLS